jgi:hypothetical protein
MPWSLINEFGIEYSCFADNSSAGKLSYPVVAERLDNGDYLIVDELDRDKPLREHLHCRTSRIASNGDIVFDSVSSGIPDGYGCVVDDGKIAILSRASWEISIFSKNYEIIQKIPLWTFSKRFPRSLYFTKNETFLITLIDGFGQYDLLEVDRHGQLLWYLPPAALNLRHPVAMQVLASGSVLCVDPPSHSAIELRRDGSLAWSWGRFDDPAGDKFRLCFPWAIQELSDGKRLIADSRNHRILLVGAHGLVSEVQSPDVPFWEPMDAKLTSRGTWLVCDRGNKRVIEFDVDGEIVWQFPYSLTRNRFLSFPRSIEIDPKGCMLVSDSAHNRILEIINGRPKNWPLPTGFKLFWPRCARRTGAGSIIIADSRNSRIVEVDDTGELRNALAGINLSGRSFPEDPHDIRILGNGNLLIADAALNLVVETDWSGNIQWVIGDEGIELSDPHSAQQLDDGRVLIADTGHRRLAYVNRADGRNQVWSDFYQGPSCFRLRGPRYAEMSPDGTLIVVDTGNNRVLCIDSLMQLLWVLSDLPQSPISSLNYPRWAQSVKRNEILVSDHLNHRIVHARYTPC